MTVPEFMKGVVLTGHGGPDKLEWRTDLPVPHPDARDVLIKVGASAVNNTDINTRIGWYSKSVRGDTETGANAGFGEDADADGGWAGALDFPLVQGADCCGTIVAVGQEVDPARIGERVLVRPMHTPLDAQAPYSLATFGSERDGAFAEYATIASKDAVAIQSDLSDLELASFPCAFTTAEGMIQRIALGAERVLITGASGGVGSAAIQLAKRRGAHVTAQTSPSKAAALRDLGADEILTRDDPLPDQAFDAVLDLVGGPRWPELLETLRKGGRYVTSGAIAGPIVELDLRTLYLRDLSLAGSTWQPDSVLTDLVGYIERGEIHPMLADHFPLQRISDAQEAFLSKSHIGKIGLTIE
ncbi:alcohol dehydrogenase family protein [Thalassococcus lentus]|uniref:Alcohol dehydrogenase family protein n=1 Tax=Thalassococcus lentus TaxID=1210524 RepID=A0ABT4XU99_9RHOB|nr:alcohol dehydrogenase family protein [Thalassococcus lentus]MDA7425472.1 alcohol dehydrogenase family protein [Thalassococcus lentus]